MNSYTALREPNYQFIAAHELWSHALRQMSKAPDLVATGVLRRDTLRVPTAVLVDELAISARPPEGREFALQADWIAIAMPGGNPPDEPSAWLERLKPRFAQLLVVLLVGFKTDRSGWCGWVVERGTVRPLSGFRVVGPGMICIRSDESEETEADMTASNDGRWSRTVHAVGARAFRKIREASVAVIGSSRSGNLAAGMLASLGVKQLILIDGDRVEPHNLDGMVLVAEDQIGENKALAVARHLSAHRADMVVRAARQPFDAAFHESILGDVDLLVTCVDQDAPRLRAARLARKRLVPHLDIGTGVTRIANGSRELAADVRLLFPGGGCVRCIGGLTDLEQAEYANWAPPGALPPRRPESWDARGRLGSLVTLNSTAVSTGIQSWIDLLNGDLGGSIWHRIRWQAGGSWEIERGLVGAGENCPICQEHH